MRILHLGKYYPPAPGGIESHVQTLARGQADLGHDVSVLCVNHADQAGNDITHSRWRKTASFTQMDGKVRVERVGRWFGVSRLEVCPALIGRLKKATSQADIVHLHTPNPLMLAAWWLAGNRETPLVVTHHSDVIKQKFSQILVRPLEKAVYKKAEAIFTTNPNYLEGSSQLAPFTGKVVSLPMGIDLSSYLSPSCQVLDEARILKEKLGWPLWLMVGRLTYYKGYHIALEAFSKVEGKMIIVGKGSLEQELKSQAEKLKIQDRLIWMPSVDQKKLKSLYHAATALWFSSIARSEGFGLVQVEAMASGCPVINTAIPASGVSWVSVDKISGLTVPVADPEALAQAALKVMSIQLRRKLSDGAKERAKSLFDADQMSANSIRLYQNLLL